MYKTISILVILLLLVAIVSPSLAQEGLTTTEPDEDKIFELYDLIVNGLLYVVAGMLVLFGAALAALYRSTPPWVQGTVRYGLGFVEPPLRQWVDRTPSPTDNYWLDFIIDKLVEHGITTPQEVNQAESKLEIEIELEDSENG